MTSTPSTQRTPTGASGTNATQNLLQVAAANGSFKTFGKAVEKAGLTETLSAPGPYTVLAPTDAAFERLPSDKLEALFKPENKKELVSLLNNHVISGRKPLADIGKWSTARTLGGKTSPVMHVGEKVSVDGATITMADIESSNGMLHGIDKVNLPTRQ